MWHNRADGTPIIGTYSAVYNRFLDTTGLWLGTPVKYAPSTYTAGGWRVYWTDASGVARYKDVWNFGMPGVSYAGQSYCYTGV